MATTSKQHKTLGEDLWKGRTEKIVCKHEARASIIGSFSESNRSYVQLYEYTNPANPHHDLVYALYRTQSFSP